MLRTKLGGLALLAGVAFYGCSGESLTRQLLDQQNDVARATCDCFFADLGYGSASECRNDSTFPIPPQAVACGERAFNADGSGEVRASTQCLLDVGDTRLACYQQAGCDQTAFDACDQSYVVDFASCPVPSPEAQAAFDQALRACIAGVGGGGGPQIDVCPEGDLGGAIGDAVASGTTSGGDNDVGGTCGGFEANDATFTWVAPATGTVTIDTNGSDFDTVLYLLEGASCGGAELACDDDGGNIVDSSLTLDVTMGEALVIVIDGYGNDAGAFVLNINY